MLRIHFSTDDLTKIRVASEPDPLWEIVLSRAALHELRGIARFRPWLRQVHADTDRASQTRPAARLLAVLAPMRTYFPDFITPPEGAAGLDAGLDAILGTPPHRIRHELRLLTRHTNAPLPSWLRPLADGDREFLGSLRDALRDYYHAAITPFHHHIRTAVDHDLARRSRSLLDGGTDGLLASLRPLMHWQPPTLEVGYPVDRDLHLRGRGLRLVPSYFCHGSPVSLADPELPPTLVYPIDPESHRTHSAPGPRNRYLRALLGSTRADVLDTIGAGATTTQVARRLNTSPASISRHTAILRRAGIITTRRIGPAVLHTRTALGDTLLHHHGGQPVSTPQSP